MSSPENASANVLAGQLLQVTDPGWLEPPAGHGRQFVALRAPTVVEYVPELHAVHTSLLELAGDVEYFPAEHAVQALELAFAQVPLEHITHVVVPMAAYDPAPHAMHAVCPPVLNRPTEQFVHPQSLVFATHDVPYFPAWHPVH